MSLIEKNSCHVFIVAAADVVMKVIGIIDDENLELLYSGKKKHNIKVQNAKNFGDSEDRIFFKSLVPYADKELILPARNIIGFSKADTSLAILYQTYIEKSQGWQGASIPFLNEHVETMKQMQGVH